MRHGSCGGFREVKFRLTSIDFLSTDSFDEGIVTLPRPPPPFDLETLKPIEPPWQAIKEWTSDDEADLN
jgi:hypothetical protein